MSDILQNFQNPDINAKPMVRWWFPDAGAKPEKIRAQLREIYDGGFGGVEVTMVPQFTDFDAAEYGWATPAWKNVLRTILEEAVKIEGFKVDLHLGAHWPVALNTLCPNDDLQMQELVGAFEKLPKTPAGIRRIPMPLTKTNDTDGADSVNFIFEDKFVGMTAARIAEIEGDHFTLEWDSLMDLTRYAKIETDPKTGEAIYTPAGVPLDEDAFGDLPRLRDRQYYYVADRSLLPASDNDNEELQAGDWMLFGFWRRGSGQVLSGKAFEVFSLSNVMRPKTYVLNFWDPEGTRLLTRFWDEHILDDPEMSALIHRIGETTDSCFKGGGIGGETEGRWTATFPADFQACNGYDMMKYLPFAAFHDYHIQFYPYKFKYIMTADNGLDVRFHEDYNKTCVWLHENRVDGPLMKWAHSYGYGIREKNYAPLKDGSSGALELDQAEGATLDLRMKMDNFRDMTSGVHVAGKKYVAAEANADELMPYRLTFKNVCEKLNVCYANGLNMAIFHGASYDEELSGKYSQWPGWHAFQFSFAGAWGRRHPWWPQVHALTDYMQRTQAVLQNGRAQVDLYVYEPVRNTSEIWDGAAEGGDYQKLIAHGYTYDIGGEAVLQRALQDCITDGELPYLIYEAQKKSIYQGTLRGGRIAGHGPEYKAVILRSTEKATLGAIQLMICLARAGYPVISVGNTPNRVYGLSGSNCISDQMIQEAMKTLADAPGYHHVQNEEELIAALKNLGITPGLSFEAEKINYAQRLDRVSRWFYVYNFGSETVPVTTAADTGQCVYVGNPWTGEITRLESKIYPAVPGAARFLIYAQPELMEGSVQTETFTLPGKEIADLTDFTLSIDSWGPAGNPQDSCAMKHTTLDLGKPGLIYWSEIQDDIEKLVAEGAGSMYHISGIGTYRTIYESPAEQTVYLVTRSAEDQITGIFVNGIAQERPDAVARFSKIHLDKGVNEIVIELASTLRRRVNLENPFFTEHDFEIMFGNIENYGNAKAPDPATMNLYGLTSVKLHTME